MDREAAESLQIEKTRACSGSDQFREEEDCVLMIDEKGNYITNHYLICTSNKHSQVGNQTYNYRVNLGELFIAQSGSSCS